MQAHWAILHLRKYGGIWCGIMTENPPFRWDFNWKLCILVALLLPLLMTLGVWQLDRAEEKREISRAWQTQQSLPPLSVDLSTLDVSLDQFRRVRIEGEFLPEQYWLKENQIVNGQLGYHVIMPFRSHDNVLLAVDRGWVAGSPLRDFVPEIQTPSEVIFVEGSLVIPSDSMLIREAEVSVKSWPHKILEVDLAVMGKHIDGRLYPKALRLEEGSPGALDVYWRPINVSPMKHNGYAFQWFAMALALVIAFIFASSNLSSVIKRS